MQTSSMPAATNGSASLGLAQMMPSGARFDLHAGDVGDLVGLDVGPEPDLVAVHERLPVGDVALQPVEVAEDRRCIQVADGLARGRHWLRVRHGMEIANLDLRPAREPTLRDGSGRRLQRKKMYVGRQRGVKTGGTASGFDRPRRSPPAAATGYRRTMTERKPPGVGFETWVERQLREAAERGRSTTSPAPASRSPTWTSPTTSSGGSSRSCAARTSPTCRPRSRCAGRRRRRWRPPPRPAPRMRCGGSWPASTPGSSRATGRRPPVRR